MIKEIKLEDILKIPDLKDKEFKLVADKSGGELDSATITFRGILGNDEYCGKQWVNYDKEICRELKIDEKGRPFHQITGAGNYRAYDISLETTGFADAMVSGHSGRLEKAISLLPQDHFLYKRFEEYRNNLINRKEEIQQIKLRRKYRPENPESDPLSEVDLRFFDNHIENPKAEEDEDKKEAFKWWYNDYLKTTG